MQRGLVDLAGRAPARLAIDRHHRVAAQRRNHRRHPAAKGRLELVRIDQREHPLEGVVGGDAVLEHHEPAQPLELLLAPRLDVGEVVRPAQHRAHGHRQQLGQVVADLARAARIGNRHEHPHQRRDCACLHGNPKKTENYTIYAPVNRGWVTA